jgi:transcriptional regulator GlxA family with amidase domain
MAHLDKEGFDTVKLGRALALSRTQLYRRLKPLIGFSPAHYIRFVRLSKAKDFLDKEDLTVSEVAYKTGFASHSHFTRAFRTQFGFKPSEIRQLQNKKSRITDHSSFKHLKKHK